MKRLELVDGAQVDAPSADTVRDAVGNLSASIEFVVLRRDGRRVRPGCLGATG